MNSLIRIIFLSLIVIASSHAGSISINFMGPQPMSKIAPTSPAGINGALHWNNVSEKNGSLNILTDDQGTNTNTSIVWSSATIWSDGSAYGKAQSGNTDAQIVSSYLDDGENGNGVDIKVTNIPYASYSIVIYLATDTANGSYRPFTINGQKQSTDGTKTTYKNKSIWDATNTITVKDLSGDLVIDGSHRSYNNRGSIAAIQIISTAPMKLTKPLMGLGGITVILKKK